MKTTVRTIILALLIAAMLPVLPVVAQDGGNGDELVVAPDLSAVYYLSATSGSFADQGDGTYLLTLEGIGDDLVWIASQPTLSIGTLSNVNLNTQWGAAAGLSTEAALQVGDLNVELTVTSPAYADGVQTYVATVGEITSLAGEKEPELPMTFEAAQMALAWNVAFQNGLIDGIAAMYEGMRATPEECATAQQQWDAYVVWNADATQRYIAAHDACNYQKDAAACAEATQIRLDQRAAANAIRPVAVLLNTECS